LILNWLDTIAEQRLKVEALDFRVLNIPKTPLTNYTCIMIYNLLLVALAISVAGGLSQSEKNAWVVGQGVKTTSGTVFGHAAKDKTQVSEYLGIAYAKPPVGNLRWAAPVKFTGSGNITASQYVSTPGGLDSH